jgi:hypothetical protein
MNTTRFVTLTALVLMLLFSCGNMEEKSMAPSANEDVGTDAITAPVLASIIAIEEQGPGSSEPVHFKTPEKIIKTADIAFRVDDYKKSRIEIEKIIRAAKAYIADENEQNTSYSISNNMTIRVLNNEFDALLEKLTDVAAEINSKNVNARDVTAQFVDVQARLKTKKEVEQRYVALLQKANKISEILEIEEKLRVIREEIEAKEGELKLLTDQVSYSTINLNFYQTHEFEPSSQPGFFNRMGSAMASGWKGLLEFSIVFMHAWPVWLILGAGGWLLYRYIKRMIKGKPSKVAVINKQ